MTTHTPTTSTALLQFSDVSLGYGNFTVLKGINISAKHGQVVALMGGSGSGKTTLLRAATGQILPRSGTLSLFGEDICSFSEEKLQKVRQRMGVLFQQGALFTDLTVFENVAFPLREHTKKTESEIAAIVLEKLNDVGLRAAAHLRIGEISGGMARRVALARAIVLEPELIFYDEPFAGLDPVSLGITAQLIRDLTNRLNCASVIIAHDVPEAFSIADQVYILGQGKLLAEGTPTQLSASTDPYVHQFLNGTKDGPIAFHYPVTPAFEQWLAQRKP